jgi:alcohol dehydrogenase-like protein
MRAALIKAFGEPTEVLELADVPEPSGPAAGEVLVGVEYAPINMNDLYVIQGAFPVRPSLPSIVGNEGVGRVLAVGSGVSISRSAIGSSSRSMPSVGANGWSCLRQVYSASPRPNRSNWRCWASIRPRRLYSSTNHPISSLATGSSKTLPIQVSAGRLSQSPKRGVLRRSISCVARSSSPSWRPSAVIL